MADRLKIVLDTSVLIAALRSRRSASAEVILRILRSEVRIVLSLALLYEYRDVAMRVDQIAASQLARAEIEELIDQLEIWPSRHCPMKSDDHYPLTQVMTWC